MSGRAFDAWIAWAGATVAVAILTTIVVLTFVRSLEGTVFVFGLGMTWHAATPMVLRWAGRLTRGPARGGADGR